MYSSKTKKNNEYEYTNKNEFLKYCMNFNDKNNDLSNELENGDQNNEILVTFQGSNNINNNNIIGSNYNFKENENDLSNYQYLSSNKEIKYRPSTAIFSISSKMSLKNHIERIKSKIFY